MHDVMIFKTVRGKTPDMPGDMTARRVFLVLALALSTGGCSSQIQLMSGATGPAMPAGATIAIVGVSQDKLETTAKAQDAVIAALARRGRSVSSDAQARLDIGLTDRSASTGIGVIGGETLSPAKAHKFLQSCKDRTYRLTLAYYGAGADVPITRAWAEEHHCKGTIDASIASLAEKAVAALELGASAETDKRRGKE